MKLQRIPWIGGVLYVWPDKPGVMTPAHALAGPFETEAAARWWLLERLESRFDADQKKLWDDAAWIANAQGIDVRHLLGVAMLVALKRPASFVLKCAAPARMATVVQMSLVPRDAPDLKLLVAGDRP